MSMTEQELEHACRNLCNLLGEDPDADVQIQNKIEQPTTKYPNGMTVVHSVHITPTYSNVKQWTLHKAEVERHQLLTQALANVPGNSND